MSVLTQPVPPMPTQTSDIPDVPIYRLSVEQYHAMIRAGILQEDEPVELLEGLLVCKMTKNPPHNAAIVLMSEALRSLLPDGWYLSPQNSVTTDDSEPEPDCAVVRGAVRQFLDHNPGPQDVALVVEVADTSLSRDRGFKKRLYASAGFPIYWIVNLIDRRIEVYTEPTGPAEQPDYRCCQNYGPDDEVPLVLDGQEVGRLAVRELLP